jgi:hypothetical protein
MLSVKLLTIAVSMVVAALTKSSPFYWQDEHPDYLLSYQSSCKMEQIGRTGVAAMHAVLIRYDPVLKGLIHCNIKWLKLMFVFEVTEKP